MTGNLEKNEACDPKLESYRFPIIFTDDFFIKKIQDGPTHVEPVDKKCL